MDLFCRDYDKDAPGTMTNATVLYVETILQQRDFPGKLRKFFNRYFMEIDAVVKRIPAFLQVNSLCLFTTYSDKEFLFYVPFNII